MSAHCRLTSTLRIKLEIKKPVGNSFGAAIIFRFKFHGKTIVAMENTDG